MVAIHVDVPPAKWWSTPLRLHWSACARAGSRTATGRLAAPSAVRVGGRGRRQSRAWKMLKGMAGLRRANRKIAAASASPPRRITGVGFWAVSAVSRGARRAAGCAAQARLQHGRATDPPQPAGAVRRWSQRRNSSDIRCCSRSPPCSSPVSASQPQPGAHAMPPCRWPSRCAGSRPAADRAIATASRRRRRRHR